MGVASCLSIICGGKNCTKWSVGGRILSVIRNREVVRSFVCIETMLKSIRAKGSVRYIEAVRSWEGPL